jgi:hypothetical protein
MFMINMCVQQSDGRTVCMYANFGLVCKKSAGRDVSASNGDPAYFIADDVVRAFTNDYQDNTSSKKVS